MWKPIIFCLLFCSFSPAVLAWSKGVHVLVCEAAYKLTSNDGRRLVDEVAGDDWPQSCTWADEVRHSTHKGTYQYHFVNVPKRSGRLDVVMAKDCAAHDCVHQAVKRYVSYLVRDKRDGVRLEALRFVGHFVADLHQPLHAGYGEDLGGNRIDVRIPGEGTRNLHAVWDGFLPRQAGLSALSDLRDLVDGISAEDKRKWRTINFAGAVQVSHDLAREYAYRKPGGSEMKDGMRMERDYIDAALPIVRQQLRKSAVRLAHLLHLIGREQLQPEDLDG